MKEKNNPVKVAYIGLMKATYSATRVATPYHRRLVKGQSWFYTTLSTLHLLVLQQQCYPHWELPLKKTSLFPLRIQNRSSFFGPNLNEFLTDTKEILQIKENTLSIDMCTWFSKVYQNSVEA